MWLSLLLILSTVVSFAEELSLEQQRVIVENYMYVTGQTAVRPASLTDPSTGEPIREKCGTPAILEYQRNRDRLDRRLLASLGVQDDVARPVTQAEYGNPGGHVLLHYDLTGAHAVWQAGVDSDGDSVPDYVEMLANIADSCYVHIVDTLGYPRPMVDSICLDGGDARVDVYIRALPYGFYGMTYNQSECYEPDIQHEAGWITIDRDFQQIPGYAGRALDAARVTLAHELFHTVHFAIDATEHITWFEMSSVWMEEEIYDSINDYYVYDDIFFDRPRLALNDTTVAGHMYQAVVFPIYLSEKYGRDIIKAVWLRAGELGLGPNYLKAFDEVIDSASQAPANAKYRCLCYNTDSTRCLDSVLLSANFTSAMTEFAVWNFFTGPYADQSPNGIGYSEAANYAFIHLDSLDIRRTYPSNTIVEPTLSPAPNGTAYVRLENLQSIDLDSLLTMYLTPDANAIVRWGVGAIFQMEANPDSNVVVTDVVDVWETWICRRRNPDLTCADSAQFPGRYVGDMLGEWVCTDGEFGTTLLCGPSTCNDSVRAIDLRPYHSITLVLCPTTFNFPPYTFGRYVDFNFSIYDSSFVNEALANQPASILTPYPNPAVAREMDGQGLTFRFGAKTDSTSFPAYSTALMQLDIYSVAGELVRTLESVYAGLDRIGPVPGQVYEIGWDMKNQAGKEVASGVYLAVARLFGGADRATPLAEDRVKVAVIR
ncbi:MAG: DUF6055 domain-containing protein [candidate division Zixibacteria bacterium]|nr:DUF6055 domain-containing protein [candidate division Zixibacteria bacterium]